MKRDIKKLESSHFDVLIIGAGIHGATAAAALARAGYRTALIDRADFGGATSANSLKIIHGGIRYLQHLNLKRMRDSIRCRREMLALAPHLVRPLPCLTPTSGRGLRSTSLMRLALWINDLIAWDRNRGVAEDNRLPGSAILSQRDALRLIPGLAADKTSGAALWHDGLAMNTERLTLAYIKQAVTHGAMAVNYLAATGLVTDGNHITGIRALDHASGASLPLQADRVINAAGPWLNQILKSLGAAPNLGLNWALGLNIIVAKQLFPNHGVGLDSSFSFQDRDAILKKGKRLFFFVPWRGHTMIGTSYKPCTEQSGSFTVTREDIESLVHEVNAIYPRAALTMADVSFYHAGLLPMTPNSESDPTEVQPAKESSLIDHGKRDGLQGLFSLVGVKYTTAPCLANRLVHLLQNQAPPANAILRKIDNPVSADLARHTESSDRDNHCLAQLWPTYGAESRQVLAHADRQTNDNNALGAQDLLTAQIRYSIHEEMAMHLSDFVFRRTAIGTAARPDQATLAFLADTMGAELGWNKDTRAQEISRVLERYRPLDEKIS